jgi:SAM-dependent methyltransferase
MNYLTHGIPSLADLDALMAGEYYASHVSSNQAFLDRNGDAMAAYRRRWEYDPFRLWSRRWEYPFAATQVLDFASTLPSNAPMRLLDAGSGVTYFPHFLCAKLPELQVTCADYDASYTPMFAAIAGNEGHERVRFAVEDLRKLGSPDASFDAVACVSVLEHTDQYTAILDEFRRVLRPGGLLVLTFDLSIDDRFELSRRQASELLTHLQKHFIPTALIDVATELRKLDSPAGLLSTDEIKRRDPGLLPWRRPMLKAIHDLYKGHGWTGGFRSKSVYCLSAHAK